MVTLTAYAEDTPFLARDAHSLRSILNKMKKFEVFLSLKNNMGMWSWVDREGEKLWYQNNVLQVVFNV